MLNKLPEEWFRTPTLAAGAGSRPILEGMGGAHPETGSILAEHPGVPSVEQAERWYRARATSAYMSAMRGKLAWLIALDTFIVGVLALTGYPAPRVVALAVAFCASLTMFVVWLSRTTSVLAPTGAWHTRYALLLTRTVGDSACQLGRAREEMVYRALARAREMEQIGWKLSHELKNPLAAIKGLVQLSARNVTICDPDLGE